MRRLVIATPLLTRCAPVLLVLALAQVCVAQDASPSLPKVRCVIVGDGAAGKTSMVISYTTNTFPSESIPSVADPYTKSLVVDGRRVQLEIVDTAGGDDFVRIRPQAYPNTDVFLIVHAVGAGNAAESVRRWRDELRRLAPRVPLILVGSKKDLLGDANYLKSLASRGIEPMTAERGRKLAAELGLQDYRDCSALTQEGLKDVFETAVRWAQFKVEPDPENVVASRLVGEWVREDKVSRWLGAGFTLPTIGFLSDPTVLVDLPASLADDARRTRVYLAGRIDNGLADGKAQPRFLLVQRNGNMCLLTWDASRPELARTPAPMKVMLAPATDGKHDLLFLAPAAGNGGCVAYTRKGQG